MPIPPLLSSHQRHLAPRSKALHVPAYLNWRRSGRGSVASHPRLHSAAVPCTWAVNEHRAASSRDWHVKGKVGYRLTAMIGFHSARGLDQAEEIRRGRGPRHCIPSMIVITTEGLHAANLASREGTLRDNNRCNKMELYEVTRGSRTLAIAAAFPIAGEAVRCMLGASAELASRSVDGRSGGNAASESWVRYHRTFRRRSYVPYLPRCEMDARYRQC